MPLHNIAEDDIVDSFDTTDLNTETRPLGYRTIYGTPLDDNLSMSTYSTNATAPNLPGTGRVLGKFYDSSGKRLERALGDIARKAGFGPEAVYEKICVLSQGDWTKDDKQASLLQRHCLKLFEHASSVVDLTRLQAIKRWGDILQYHHEIYVWLFCKKRTEIMACVDKLIRNVEVLRESIGSPSDLEILDRTASLIDCHSVGLELIRLSRGTILMDGRLFEVEWQDLRKFSTEDVEKWDIFFHYLLDSTLTASLSDISRWYIRLWSTQIEHRKLHGRIAFQACHTLRNTLAAEEQLHTVRLGLIQSLCENIYVYLTQFLDFGAPPTPTGGNDRELHDSVTMHFSTAVTTLNNLVRSYNSVIPQSSLLLLPGRLKEKIRPLLTTAGNGQLTEESKTILVQIFNRLLDHALFEIKDGACLAELSDCVSFDDESTRSSALLQLGDILQSIPEVYKLMITLGGHETKDHVLEINKSLEKDQFKNTSESKCGIFTNLHLILQCHTFGFELHRLLLPIRGRSHLEGKSDQVEWKHLLNYPSDEIEKWGVSFQFLLESLSNPTISTISQRYIGFWSSQLVEGTLHAHIVLQYCRSLQNVLGTVHLSQISRWDALQGLCKEIYMHLVRRFDSDTVQLDEGAHISSTLNGLTQMHDRVFSPKLGPVPNLACLTILGSTDLISANVKEEIGGLLKGLEDDNEELNKEAIKMVFLQSCSKLLKRASSELKDRNCFNKLKNAKSFSDGTSRWAILQLGDILQSLPELYMLLITLGGDEIRNSVESLRQSLQVSDNPTSTLERYPRILMNLRSLLACHATGLWLVSEHMSFLWPYKADDTENFITRTDLSNNNAREIFMSYLRDNVTFNLLIFYLKHCISRIRRVEYIWYYSHSFLSCSIVQGALLTEKGVPQEKRSAMEELCRSMQNSIIERLRCSVEYFSGDFTELGHAMWSVYGDLTKSKQAFADEAEVYLSQLCNECFEIILKTRNTENIRNMNKELSDFFTPGRVFGWFLSIRGSDAEESISRLLGDPRYSRFYKWPFSHLEAHKLGVELLAPRHERLHFEGAGLTKHFPKRTDEPPLTPEQRERWIDAFKTLAANLRSSISYLIGISLFYFANCPLPHEADPMLDTALALDYCESLQENMSWGWRREDVSRAVYHIHTCLTKRVVFVQESCMELAPDEPPTFYGTPFETSKVLQVLNDLTKLSKEKLRSDAPELLPIPDY